MSRPKVFGAQCCMSLLLLFLGLTSLASVARAQCTDTSCQYSSCNQPAFGVPDELWGELKPVDEGELPDDRDNSDYPDGQPGAPAPGPAQPLWIALDIENNWLFSALSHGLQIWDLASPTVPVRTANLGRANFPAWPADPHEGLPVRDIEAPPGNDNMVAVGLAGQGGLIVFNTANKAQPTARYVDNGKTVFGVHSAKIGSTEYAFSATGGTNILAHSLTAVAGLSQLCAEQSPGGLTCGVYRGQFGNASNFLYIDGVGNSTGTQHWIAASSGGSAFGLEIWDVSSPTSPQFIMRTLTTQFVHGVAMWRSGSNYYLGARTGSNVQIYNVSCLSSASCGTTLGSPISTRTVAADFDNNFLTYSQSSSRGFLHVGNFNRCATGLQNEWLFDVTNPANPVDITPPPGLVNGTQTGYWGYYYRRNPTGFNNVSARSGKFHGQYFYRMAYGIFDIHELTSGGAPTASFTYSPSSVYMGQPVDFTSTSLGSPTSFSWTFQNASPGTSSAASPQDVVFGTVGSAQVSLTATNGFGNDTETQTIAVLDPTPNIASVAPNVTTAFVCQPVSFTANTVTGSPTPSLSWTVDTGQQTVASGGNVNPFVWDTTSASPGSYTATATAMNTAGTDTATSVAVTLSALPALPAVGNFAPTNDAFGGGTVQFHLNVPGATAWCWSFGDGSTFPTGCASNVNAWSTDPVAGPNPTHTYAATGTYSVTVQIRNCIEGARTSAPLSVQVTQITPLIASFTATAGVSCFGNFCEGQVGQAVTFTDQSQGSPTGWSYAFNHTGTTADTCSFGSILTAPDTSHTFSQAGNYRPCLRVHRGTETSTYLHPLISIVTGGGGGSPTVTVSGPTSGTVGQMLTYGATTTNCSPAPTSWTWDVNGGTINGASTGNSIQVSFASAGSKMIRATAANGGCNGTSGTRTVTISAGGGGGGGGGTLAAAFSFTPSAPTAGQSVSFNGSASTGSPTGYSWNFGDGSTGSGNTTTHTFANAGTYQVQLEVSKAGTGTGCSFGLCTASVSHTVVVGGGGPVLSASFTTGATCDAFQCTAEEDTAVSFTSTSQNATQLSWNFGDGSTASGVNVSHTWSQPGNYLVVLTAGDGTATATAQRLFEITEVENQISTVIVPWIADTSGALDQESDLYLYNPNETAVQARIIFRKRGIPEDPQPTTTQTIPPHGTLYLPNLLAATFGRNDASGFLVIEAEDIDRELVAVSFNRTLQDDGSTYGQLVQGLTLDELESASPAVGSAQYLLGLYDTPERRSYFGLTNPHPIEARYRLRFVDKNGGVLAAPTTEFSLPPWGQRQYQNVELHTLFGVMDKEDFRVEVTRTSGDPIYAYAGLVRQGTQDPAFVQVSTPTQRKVHLLGVASTPGFNAAFFQSDVVLSNPTDQPLSTAMKYRNVGPASSTLGPLSVDIPPNGTVRLVDVLGEQFELQGVVGTLTFENGDSHGVFPMIHGETYQNSGPSARYGLFMPARTESEIATQGKRVVLAGLRQHQNEANSTVWLLNPGAGETFVDLIYRGLDGTQLGMVDNYAIPAGASRQINPSFHLLPAGGVVGGFTLEVRVEGGQVIAGAQVVINQSNDPAYLAGSVR